jgi:hypothetical protein
MSDVTISQQQYHDAIVSATKRILEHPFGVICKHWMLTCLLSELEKQGMPMNVNFVKAVVDSDDDSALELLPVAFKE